MTDPLSRLARTAADEALLEQLAEALRPPPLTPPAASLAALRREVDLKWKASVRSRVRAKLLAWARRLQRTGAAVAVLGGVAVGGTGMALAAGGSSSRPVHYSRLHPGIPVQAPAPDPHRDDRDRGAAAASVRPVSPDAGRGVSTAVWPRSARPVTTGATPAVVMVPAPPRRTASGVGGAPVRPPSAPVIYRVRAAAGSGLSPPTTNRTPTDRPDSADGLDSWSPPGVTSVGPAGGPAPTPGSVPTASGTWRTGSGWPEMSSGSPTTSATTWTRRPAAAYAGDGAHAPIGRPRYRDSRR
jgi:hypothetical protein